MSLSKLPVSETPSPLASAVLTKNNAVAESVEKNATTKKTSNGPIRPINKAATAGPIAKPVANTASWIELARSSESFAPPATSGMIDFLAVPAAGFTMARPSASKTSRAKETSIE